MRITWLLVACLCFPLHSWAQSQKSNDVVSVRELSIPPKAHRAFEQGAELLVKNNAVESLPLFQRAAGEFAGYYEAYYEMGVADLKLRRLPDAAQAFQKSIDLSGAQYSRPLLALGAVLAYQGKYTEAEGVINKGLALDPASWSGHYYLGWVLSSLNRLEEAEKSVREAVRLKCDSPEAMRLLADIHSREKDYRSLVNDLDEYLKLDPDSPIAVRARALRGTAQRLLDVSQSSSALVQPQN
jgi:tetratricopeptide (TPR) repeat protein